MSKIPFETDALLYGGTFDHVEPDVAEPPDPFEKLLADGALAANLGGIDPHAAVRRLREETQETDARFRKLSPDRPNPWASPLAKSDDLDAELTVNDSRRLEKSSDRRKQSLTAWVKSELALRKATVRELADYARKHDPETADLILEVGAELGAE